MNRPASSACWLRGLALTLTLLLAACQQQPVSIDYNPDIDFGHYHSYDWQTSTSGTGSDVEPLLAERVQSAVASVLEQRGFQHAQDGSDMLIRYFLAATAKTTDSRSRGSVGIGGGGGNIGLGVSMGFPIGGTRIKQRLQLTLDVLAADTGKLAWRGVKELTLPDNDPAGSARVIHQAVEEMLAKFPPQ